MGMGSSFDNCVGGGDPIVDTFLGNAYKKVRAVANELPMLEKIAAAIPPDGLIPMMGPKGDQGDPGLSAYEIAVEHGYTGTEAAWLASLEGPAGPQGLQGIQGPVGAQGIQGEQGVQGIQGIKGDTGDIGPQGEIGPDGLSAYQIALDNGFVGTEAQWLASLVGPQGPQGETGEQGPVGETGPQGPQGDAGPQGIQGVPGTNGTNGADGTDGTIIYSGNGGPSAGLGLDGDFYINTNGPYLFGPKTTGAWGSGRPLFGNNGLNIATVRIFQRAAAAPTKPTGISTFTYSSGSLTGLNNGWSTAFPAAGDDPVWACQVYISSTGTQTAIDGGQFSNPVIFTENGADGAPGENGGAEPWANVASPIAYGSRVFATNADNVGEYNVYDIDEAVSPVLGDEFTVFTTGDFETSYGGVGIHSTFQFCTWDGRYGPLVKMRDGGIYHFAHNGGAWLAPNKSVVLEYFPNNEFLNADGLTLGAEWSVTGGELVAGFDSTPTTATSLQPITPGKYLIELEIGSVTGSGSFGISIGGGGSQSFDYTAANQTFSIEVTLTTVSNDTFTISEANGLPTKIKRISITR